MLSQLFDWSFEYMLPVGIVTLLIVMCLGFFYLPNLFRKRSPMRFIMLFLVFAPFIAYWCAIFSGNYGYAHTPKEVTACGNSICFIDTYTRRSQFGNHDDLRLYIVNAETGKKTFRSFIGNNGDILAEQDGLLFYSADQNYYVIETATGNIVKTYSPETIPKLYPQTSSGVGKIDFENGENEAPMSMLLNVTAKNGNNYFIDPFSGKFSDSTFSVSTKPLRKDDGFDYVKLHGDGDTARKRIEFIDKPGSVGSLLATYSDHHYTNAKAGTTFLFPAFAAMYGDAGVAIIKSYETTDKINFLLTGISTDMKQLWQINQKDLDNSNELKHSTRYKDNFIFNLDDTYYSINAQTGAVNWKVTL